MSETKDNTMKPVTTTVAPFKDEKQVFDKHENGETVRDVSTKRIIARPDKVNLRQSAVKKRVAKDPEELRKLENSNLPKDQRYKVTAPFNPKKQRKAVVYQNGVPVPMNTSKIYHHNWNE